jgi:small subunit ribosomal protein S9
MSEEKKTTTSAKGGLAKKKYLYGKGGRKTAVAQVRLFQKGKGDIEVNGKKLKEYFKTAILQQIVAAPLELTGHAKDVDLTIKTHSGGQRGQAEACRHGISRALILLDKELRPALKAEGYLKRDPRVKERKKPGLKRARKAPQWSKR